MEIARPTFTRAAGTRSADSLLAFARADLELRLARHEALLGLSYDADAYDALIARRRSLADTVSQSTARVA